MTQKIEINTSFVSCCTTSPALSGCVNRPLTKEGTYLRLSEPVLSIILSKSHTFCSCRGIAITCDYFKKFSKAYTPFKNTFQEFLRGGGDKVART
jgi:hypothetical protein